MKNFTIENDTNNIGIHASAKEAEAVSIPSASVTRPRWRSWRPPGPPPGWWTPGTRCPAPLR